MKIKVDQLIFISIVLHIFSTQGVLTYMFFDLFGYWEIKSALQPISMMLLVLSFSLKYNSIKLKYEDILIGTYSVFLIALLIINVDNLFSFYIGFREVFLIFLLSFLLSQYHFSAKQYKYLVTFLNVLIIINIFMVSLSYYLGPEAYMKLITGRFQWGTDEISKFQISGFLSTFLRSPGAVGSSGALAYFAVFSYFFFDIKRRQNFKKILAFTLLLSTFTRSALLCLFVYEGFKFISHKKNLKKLVYYGKILVPLFIVGIIIIAQLQVFSTTSLYMRLEMWTEELQVDYNWLFGGAIGEVGGTVRGEGVESVLDNYWLFMLYSTGLLGIFLWFVFFYEKSKVSRKKFYFTIGIICSGGFVMLTQAIPFLVMFPLLFANFKAIDDER